jgi:hypothetical protein
MPTPKALRAQPTSCSLENYILVRTVGDTAGLINIDDRSFTPCSPSQISTSYDPGKTFQDMGISVPIEIGFSFKFDNIVYKKFMATTKGYVILVDPTNPTFDFADLFNSSYWTRNSAIKTSLTKQHVILAPWFDNLRNVADTISLTSSSNNPYTFYGMSSQQLTDIECGLVTAPQFMNAFQAGVKYFRDSDSQNGRRLIVRWNSLSNFSSIDCDIIRFELVLYENGRIEFRYAARSLGKIGNTIASSVGASIGIFATGSYRFRDFSHGLGYRDDSRNRYKYGGCIYDSNYIDTDTTTSGASAYSCMLTPQNNWPAIKDVGAMYTFMPQVNRRKILPRLEQRTIDSRLTLPITKRTGDVNRLGSQLSVYDDRRSAPQYGATYTSEVTAPNIKPGNNIDGMYVASNVLEKNVLPGYDSYESQTITSIRTADGDPNYLYDMIFRFDAVVESRGQALNNANTYYVHPTPWHCVRGKTTASCPSDYYMPQEYNKGLYYTTALIDGTSNCYTQFQINQQSFNWTGQITTIAAVPFGFDIQYRGDTYYSCITTLEISDPHEIYSLDLVRYSVQNFQYYFKIPVRGGASMTMSLDVAGAQYRTAYDKVAPITAPTGFTPNGYWAQLKFIDSMLTERLYPITLFSPSLGDATIDRHYADTVSTIVKYEGQPELIYNVTLYIRAMVECCLANGTALPNTLPATYTPTQLSDHYLPLIWNPYSNINQGYFDCKTVDTDGSTTGLQVLRPFVLTGSLSSTTYNALTLEVSDPYEIYYLNVVDTATDKIFFITYNMTIPIRGGANLTLKYEVFNGTQLKSTKLGTWTKRDSFWYSTNQGLTIDTPQPPSDGQLVYITFASRSIAEIGNGGTVTTITSPTIVNYPTTLPRFFSETDDGGVKRQDLFAGDFETTGAINYNAAEQFINIEDTSKTTPFSEDKIFTDPQSTDSFYASDSRINELGLDLRSSLASKTQIKLSLPIDYSVKLIGTASTIHYYNSKNNAWNVPHNAQADIVLDRSTDSLNYRIIEDQRGFGPIGNNLASGSFVKTTYSEHTDLNINTNYTKESYTTAIGKQYDKSITINSDYEASSDESFSVPIMQPFLLEKAVIELPLAVGNGWFQDKTTCIKTIEAGGGGFDFGGPGITVSLFNQLTANNSAKRDLIMSGTITHDFDNVNSLVLSSFAPYDTTFHLRPYGFRAYGGTPTAVITPELKDTSYQFTGTVNLKCESMVSNGTALRVELGFLSNTVSNEQYLLNTLNTENLPLHEQEIYPSGIYKYNNIAYINNIGRAGTGFEPSPRSILGKEFVSSNKVVNGKIRNPFYIPEGNGIISAPDYNGLSDQFIDAITNNDYFICEAVVPIEEQKPSPYLLMPGDKLVLAVSKTRPVYMGSTYPTPNSSGSYEHDVQLITGTVHITLYGSLLREGKEYHDTLNQPLASEAIHELIASSPVLDQFEANYSDSYIGCANDDYILGDLLSTRTAPHGLIEFISGTRGKVFSKALASSAPTQGTTEYDYTESLSVRSQPYTELSNNINALQLNDDSERFYDSMLPSFSSCVEANGAQILAVREGQGGVLSEEFGLIKFDYRVPGILQEYTSTSMAYDWKWNRSYPFEPRYSKALREIDIRKTFVTSYEYAYPYVTSIKPRVQTKLMIASVGSRYPSNHSPIDNKESLNHFNLYLTDRPYDRVEAYIADEPSITDLIKVIYGFGDLNNMLNAATVLGDGTGGIIGTNHFADFRKIFYDLESSLYGVSPIIRGWKYGLYSGFPAYSKAYYRLGSYGQFRDMLEQRQYTKFYNTTDSSQTESVVTIKFLDGEGKITSPENTWSQNLSLEATSSVPYVDGEIHNRTDLLVDRMNSTIVSF